MNGKQPRKHAELIKAWADGAEIQVRIASSNEWGDAKNPYWAEHYEYRIKPEPKPDVVQFCNLKLTFDGETGEIKSAEVLT